MDKTIRRNEICIVGLPRCDFVFSSTRSCFIAYGFNESPLEMSILRKLLEARGIQAVEAGGALAPAQNAFCAKICSKIITAQFCVVLLNNENADGREIPNANVNMEYGLMLGFNKYVIPFQRESQKLPFNVAGLDTVKYSDRDFDRLAAGAIDRAIETTKQDTPPPFAPDQVIQAFFLAKQALICRLGNEGEKNLYDLGFPLGFNLLNDFTGMEVIYFGNFTSLRPEVVLWRLRTLKDILDKRLSTVPVRVQHGMISPSRATFAAELLGKTRVWVLVTSDDDKSKILAELVRVPLGYATEIYSLNDMWAEVSKLGHSGA